MVSTLKKVLMKKPQSIMSEVNLEKWNYGSPLSQERIDKDYKEFEKIIRNSGVQINYLQIEEEQKELCDSIFTHDPSLLLNQGAIILNMGKKLRKEEARLHKKFYDRNNIPIIGEIKENGTVEGGDCLWIDNKTLLVGESYRSNKDGINQLSKILSRLNIKCIPIKLTKNNNPNSCFHLMSIISMLDYDLAIGCLSKIPENMKEILKKRNIKLIGISEEEYIKSKTLAVNILALSPRKLVLINGYPKTQKLLLDEGNELNLFNGSELCIKAEGGPTCLTRAILRN